MKCVILAAGYATRLYPLTENFPKPLLKVGEKTILDWLVDDIEASTGAEEYILVSNHKYAHHFEAWARGSTLPTSIVDDGTTDNENRLGAVRDIQFAVEARLLNDDLLVIAGDNVLDFSLGRFVDYARAKAAPCIMRYYEPDEARLRKSGVVEIDGEDRVVSMEEKPTQPKSHWCAPPFYYLPKEIVGLVGAAINAGCGIDAPGSFAAWLCRQLPVYAMEMPGSRFDIGNLESYERAQLEYKGIVR